MLYCYFHQYFFRFIIVTRLKYIFIKLVKNTIVHDIKSYCKRNKMRRVYSSVIKRTRDRQAHNFKNQVLKY